MRRRRQATGGSRLRRDDSGTIIELWLPVSGAPVHAASALTGQLSLAGRRGNVLLVDDEELVRMSTAAMLVSMGFVVTEACSGEEALSLVEKGPSPDVLVTDHLMPGMNGVDLARTLRTSLVNLPVLIVSGYAEAEGVAQDLPRLSKPFRSAELAASLAAVLDHQTVGDRAEPA